MTCRDAAECLRRRAQLRAVEASSVDGDVAARRAVVPEGFDRHIDAGAAGIEMRRAVARAALRERTYG
jgi:hypothetical protein